MEHLDVHNAGGPIIRMCILIKQLSSETASSQNGSSSTNSIQKSRKLKDSKSRRQKTKQSLDSGPVNLDDSQCADMMGKIPP
jgi:hypothetical protein